jgi:hypothetical protein
MKIASLLFSAFFLVCNSNLASASSEAETLTVESSPVSKCSVLGAAAINVFVYCPSDLTETELVRAAKSFRSQKAAQDQNGVSVFVFNDPNGPKSNAQMVKMAERRIQKIQVAAYMDYPNGESDYFCKRNGKFQNCRSLLK